MKYVLLVSHGTLAPSLHETMREFFLGEREDLLHVNMKEGMGPDAYIEEVRRVLNAVKPEDDLIVLADLLGGSPLTYASYVIHEMGLLPQAWFLGGMNLPMAVDIMMKKDTMSTWYLMNHFVDEARNTVMPFFLKPSGMECALECI